MAEYTLEWCHCTKCGNRHRDFIPESMDRVYDRNDKLKLFKVECDACLQKRISPQQWQRYLKARERMAARAGITQSK